MYPFSCFSCTDVLSWFPIHFNTKVYFTDKCAKKGKDLKKGEIYE